jgi:tripartite-type tricarboxylate transporter receptor subunit TctC
MDGAMELARRKFLHLAAGAVAVPAVSRVATAQTYPTRPITMIVPYAAGGPSDVIAHVIAQLMTGSLGQLITIENASEANGSIGATRAARANPDGYTLILGSNSTHAVNGAFYSLSYDVLNDFAPVSPLVTAPLVLFAREALPPRDLTELVAWLKDNPNKALAALDATTVHLLFAFFQKETGTQLTLVPYGGGAPAAQDLVAGQIDLFLGAPNWISLMRAGSIKAYAATSDTRLPIAPDIPTFAEMGLPALSFSAWLGLFVPKGTSQDIISKLNAAAVEALADPTVRTRLIDLGFEIFSRERQTSEALAALQRADATKWWPLIKEFGIKAE